MNSSDTLKGFRGKRLKTQDDIAMAIGISRQVYCNYENNPLNCELTTLFKILNVMNVNDKEQEEFFYGLQQDYLSYVSDKE